MDAENQPSPFKVGLLVWVGLWAIVLAFIAYTDMALKDMPPADLADIPDEPPQMLPEFVPPEITPIFPDEQQSTTPAPSYAPAKEQPLPSITSGWQRAVSPPTRIVAPSIGLDSPVVPVGWHVEELNQGTRVVWEVADYAAGWHRNSAYPGNGGNIVLSGHNNIAGEVFRYLVALEMGDKIELYVDDKVYPYVVARKTLLEEEGMPADVRRQNARWIAPTNYERLTLVTCWPYSTYTHRLIVIALPRR